MMGVSEYEIVYEAAYQAAKVFWARLRAAGIDLNVRAFLRFLEELIGEQDEAV